MKGFYKENRKEAENKKIVISKRFLDEQENEICWEMKALSQKENEEILKKCRKMRSAGKNTEQYQETMVLAESVVFPDLNNIELQNSYKVVGKEALLLELLTAGEYEALKEAVEEVNMIQEEGYVSILFETKWRTDITSGGSGRVDHTGKGRK